MCPLRRADQIQRVDSTCGSGSRSENKARVIKVRELPAIQAPLPVNWHLQKFEAQQATRLLDT
jgi:hypothetical protein